MKFFNKKTELLSILAIILMLVAFADAQANYKSEIEKWRIEHESELKPTTVG